jgi:hypothetical protein
VIEGGGDVDIARGGHGEEAMGSTGERKRRCTRKKRRRARKEVCRQILRLCVGCSKVLIIILSFVAKQIPFTDTKLLLPPIIIGELRITPIYSYEIVFLS